MRHRSLEAVEGVQNGVCACVCVCVWGGGRPFGELSN